MRALRWCDNLGIFVTVEERISTVSSWAGADRVVVNNFALGIRPTCSWARIHTMLLDTSLGQLALRAQKTLWSAVGRTSEISRETGTDRSGSLWSAFTVWTAWVRIAGVLWFLDHWLNCNWIENVKL